MMLYGPKILGVERLLGLGIWKSTARFNEASRLMSGPAFVAVLVALLPSLQLECAQSLKFFCSFYGCSKGYGIIDIASIFELWWRHAFGF